MIEIPSKWKFLIPLPKAFRVRWNLVAPITAVLCMVLMGMFLYIYVFNTAGGDYAAVEYIRTPQEIHTEVFERYINEAWNAGNIDVLDDLLTTDHIYHDFLMDGDMIGIPHAKVMIVDFRTALPDLQVTIDSSIADEHTVWAELTLTGTNTGSLTLADGSSFPATNQPVKLSQIIVARFENGKIAEVRMEMDSLVLMQQLGFARQLDQLALEEQHMAQERRFVEKIWGAQDTLTASDFAEFCTDDAVYHSTYQTQPFTSPSPCTGSGTLRLFNAFHQAIPEPTITIDHLFASGDYTLVHITYSGVRSGYFLSLPPSDEEVQWDFAYIHRYEGDSVAEGWFYAITPSLYASIFGN